MYALERKSDGAQLQTFKAMPSRINIPDVKIRVDAPTSDWECDTHRIVTFDPPQPEGPTVDELKVMLVHQLNADAEAVRLKYITPGDGKCLAYNEIKDESLAVSNDGSNPVDTPIDQLTPEQRAPMEALYPLLSAEIPYRGSSYQAVASVVQAKYAAFRQIERQIIATVNAGKQSINAATTTVEVESAYASINWAV